MVHVWISWCMSGYYGACMSGYYVACLDIMVQSRCYCACLDIMAHVFFFLIKCCDRVNDNVVNTLFTT